MAIKECSTANVKCRNCDKQSAQTLYCFQCCSFWCEECIVGHNIIRENKDHRTLALKDFQDQDIKAVLERPAFCQKKHHEKEELKFFCKGCKVAICSTCAVTLHEGHGKMPLQEATHAHKKQISSVIKSLKDKVLEKQKEVEQFNQKSIAFQSKVAEVKSQVQSCVDQIIAIIEERKQDVFDAVDNQAKKSLESLSQKKDEVENQVKLIESAIEQTKALVKRSFSTEILGFSETFDTILQDQSTQENRDGTECIPQFSFTKSEKLINLLSMSEGIGNVVFDRNGNFLSKFGEQESLDNQLEFPQGLSINDNGDIIVANKSDKLIKVFSSSGEYLRKFGGAGSLVYPYHCIQHGQYFIVSDYGDDSIKMFNLEGKFISKFGKQGNKDGEFKGPRYLSVNKEGLLMVCDGENHRVQVFERSGKFVTKFGSEGSERGELKFPRSTANLSDGRIVVSDFSNNRIQLFDKI